MLFDRLCSLLIPILDVNGTCKVVMSELRQNIEPQFRLLADESQVVLAYAEHVVLKAGNLGDQLWLDSVKETFDRGSFILAPIGKHDQIDEILSQSQKVLSWCLTGSFKSI